MLELLVVVVIGSLFAVLAWLALTLRHQGNKPSIYPAEAIPGWTDSPADPRLGDLGVVLASGSLQDYLAQQHQGGKCPIKAFWWRDERVVSVCSPRAFKDTENLYLRAQHVFSRSSVAIHGSNSIELANGESWKRKRKCLYRTLRGDHLESFLGDFVRIATETRSLWVPGEEIALRQAMFRMTLEAILSTLLGNTLEEGELDKLVASYDHVKMSGEKKLLNDTPWSPQQEKEFQHSKKNVRDTLKRLLHARKEQKEKTNSTGKHLPMVDALLVCGAPEDDIVNDMTAFMGGFHTSGFFCMWLFLYLAQHPLIQQKLLEEMVQKVGGDLGSKLKTYVFASDSYLRQVLDEVMRISSIAVFSTHASEEDVVVEGYRLPANTPIIHAIGVSLQNTSHWKNPGVFQPDRFAPGCRHAKRGHEFRPFGVSCTRRCPANLFVYTMASVYMTVLIQHFVISSVEKGDVERKYGIITGPKGNIRIRVTLRH